MTPKPVQKVPLDNRYGPKSGPWVEVVEACARSKGVWIEVPGVFSRGVANFLRSGGYPAFMPPSVALDDPDERREWMAEHYEVTVRQAGSRDLITIYVRKVK